MSKVIPIEPAPSMALKADESLTSLILQGLDPQKPLYSHVNREAGQMLFRAGEQSGGVLILVDGQVKLSMDSADGKRLILRMAEPEEILGLASALTGMPHEMTAETVRYCRLVVLQRDTFRGIMQSNPRALAAAARELGMYYSHACKRLQMLGGTPSVSAKLARLLLEWSKDGRRSVRGVQIHLGLSHREVGEFIGATRESVSRALSQFERRSVLEIRGSVLTITDLKSLEGYAGIPVFERDDPA
jgi:CRP/FNR family transcriptional regulator